MDRFNEINKIIEEKIENRKEKYRIGRAWYDSDVLLRSAYSLMGRFGNEFMQYTVATKISPYKNKSPKELVKEWNESGKKSQVKGNLVHNFIEEESINESTKRPEYDSDKIIDNYYKMKANELKNIIPIRAELHITSHLLGLVMVIDYLGYDTVTNEVVVIDWKTNEKLTSDKDKKGRYNKMSWPFNDLYSNKINEYSVQLNLYKAALAAYGIKVDKLYIAHLTETSYDLIPIKNYQSRLKEYFSLFRPISRLTKFDRLKKQLESVDRHKGDDVLKDFLSEKVEKTINTGDNDESTTTIDALKKFF